MTTVENMDFEHLPEPFKTISELIGKRNTRKLMHEMAGNTVYFPTRTPTETIKKYIKENFNGSNVNELAKDLRVTRTTVYNYLP